MRVSGETNDLDLYSECLSWCGIDETDTTTLPLKTFVRSANFGLDRVISLILRAGRKEFDDNNNSGELLDVTENLVSGKAKYAIDVTWLKMGRVRIKDSSGNFVTLQEVDRRDLTDAELRADNGDPKKFYNLGNYSYLVPAPNYDSSGGLERQYQRGASYFAYDATTTVPGFDSDFHILIALYGARDYCEKNDLEKRAAKIRAKIGNPPSEGIVGSGLENELMERYTSKDIDEKVGLRTSIEDYGQDGSGSINPEKGFII
jgi:hypothetical protein